MSRLGKVLVLGLDDRSFLSVVRSLGRAGLEVHVAWHEPRAAVMRSRYVVKAHAVPPYDARDESWKRALTQLMAAERFDLVVPTNDNSVVPLQLCRSDLEPYGRIYLLNDRSYEVLFDKFRTTELARSVGVRVPRERVIGKQEEIGSVAAEFGLPVVAKPQASFNVNEPSGRNVVRKFSAWEDFSAQMADMIAAGPVAIQEYFEGYGVGVELLMKAGEPLMAFQHRRLHESPRGGGSAYRKSEPVSPDLLDASLRLLRPLSYTGVAMVEFRVDPRSGDWTLIEVNARFWGSLPLALAAGADFPLALYGLLVNDEKPIPKGHRVGLCCRQWQADLWYLAEQVAMHKKVKRRLETVGRFAFEAVKNVVLLRERSDTLVMDDPAPGLAELKQIIEQVWIGLRKKARSCWLRLRPVRFLLARSASRALARANTVLFVCHGNICRSPFAAAVARSAIPKKLFVSAGYHPRPDRSSPEVAVEIGAGHGVDLSVHRSCVLTEELVRSVDVIFVFDEANHRRIVADYPFAKRRVHFVGALRGSGPIYIDDPWGHDADAFARCYHDITAALAIVG